MKSYNKALSVASKKIKKLTRDDNGNVSLSEVLDVIESCRRKETSVSSLDEDGPGTPPTDPKGGGTR